jgi:hypothetical protein
MLTGRSLLRTVRAGPSEGGLIETTQDRRLRRTFVFVRLKPPFCDEVPDADKISVDDGKA